MALQSYYRGIRDIKIAGWTSENTYSTTYDVLGARSMGLTWNVESDELRGDDVIVDRYTTHVSCTVNFEQAAVDLEVLDTLLGGTLTQHANYYDLMVAESDAVPYVGIAGRIVGSSNNYDLHFFVPKAKLAGNLQLTANNGAYVLPSAEFQGVNEGTTNGMLRIRNFTALTLLTIPLRTATGGF
jgi:hypothetical protein